MLCVFDQKQNKFHTKLLWRYLKTGQYVVECIISKHEHLQ
jgi:hypothetical protein